MIAVVDYGMGNLKSVCNALDYIGADFVVSYEEGDIARASKIILPGVGAFGDGIKNIKKLGLDIILSQEVLKHGKPFLGICLGMQLLARKGFEGGECEGLGFVDGEVKRMIPQDKKIKVPQVGWNDITISKDNPLFKNISTGDDFYFVHSYQLVCDDNNVVIATCDYGEVVTAAIQRDNIFATQFHPEKSQEKGIQLLTNFTDL